MKRRHRFICQASWASLSLFQEGAATSPGCVREARSSEGGSDELAPEESQLGTHFWSFFLPPLSCAFEAPSSSSAGLGPWKALVLVDSGCPHRGPREGEATESRQAPQLFSNLMSKHVPLRST